MLLKKILRRARRLVRPDIRSENTALFRQTHEAATRLGVDKPNPRRQLSDAPNLLEQLGQKHKPTKINHNYLEYYDRHFGPIRMDVKRVLEIGVQTPASLNMWEEYFPNAEIVGLDIDPNCAKFSTGRKKVYIGDQCDRAFLRQFVKDNGGEFDIIIDDGLHTEESILTSFVELYPALTKDGIYVFEDITKLPGVVNFCADLLHLVNHFPASHPDSEWRSLWSFGQNAPWLTRNVIGVAYYRYLAFIMKGANPEHNPYLFTPEEDAAAGRELDGRINTALDAMLAAGEAITVPAVSERIGGGGYTSTRRVMRARGIEIREFIPPGS